jgi:type IV pilus assembly protein PilQ
MVSGIKSLYGILFMAGTILLSFPQVSMGRDWNIDSLKVELENLAKEQVPALNEIISITVTDVTIEEFLRAVANSSGLNINVDPALEIRVVNNFSNVRVLDILVFLCEQYDIDLVFIGNILSVKKTPVRDEITPETIGIHRDTVTDLYSLDYVNKELGRVAKEITKFTGYNVVLAPGVEKIPVSGYIRDKPFKDAIEKFAFSNNLSLRVTDDQFYIIEPISRGEDQGQKQPPQRGRQSKENEKDTYILDVKVFGNDKISVTAADAPLEEVIRRVSEESSNYYFFTSPVTGTITLQIAGANYEEFLDNTLKGSKYIYQKSKGVYVIGEEANYHLKDFRVIRFQNRTIEKLTEFIPEDLSNGIQIKEFPELNSFLISGPGVHLAKLEAFIQELDQVVPVILIDVIIVDVKKSFIVSTGIEAGIGDEPVETKGKVFPEVNIQMGSKTINDIINSFNGFGWTNLGNVTPNFYMTLRAMEDQGFLDVRSTPRLSTLNGHEASMSVGETEFYLEEQSNIIGTQNPQVETIKVYKSVIAELKVTIKPIVAGDEQITLDIVVEQSDFTERISKYSPPGSVTRKFESSIRVKNQDVILLGGLEQKSSRESSTGTPVLSRIPVLKWIFSSRTKERSNTKLNIFIKPTIIG